MKIILQKFYLRQTPSSKVPFTLLALKHNGAHSMHVTLPLIFTFVQKKFDTDFDASKEMFPVAREP